MGRGATGPAATIGPLKLGGGSVSTTGADSQPGSKREARSQKPGASREKIGLNQYRSTGFWLLASGFFVREYPIAIRGPLQLPLREGLSRVGRPTSVWDRYSTDQFLSD